MWTAVEECGQTALCVWEVATRAGRRASSCLPSERDCRERRGARVRHRVCGCESAVARRGSAHRRKLPRLRRTLPLAETHKSGLRERMWGAPAVPKAIEAKFRRMRRPEEAT